ncbi:chymotrypsin inhibitor [Musca domestica]|uniref:Chymotrypsin inhibitor n=1 Tax=Musca domestica TaxID=7370 RepID=A0A1I8MTH3_MUSDO|nr:chymotrypsin inhibitor [Musca domestica]
MAKVFQQLLILFAVLALFAGQGFAAPQECGENQEFTTCGTACPLKCNTPEPSFCTLQCVIGCQCKQGYRLNDSGACVLTKDC